MCRKHYNRQLRAAKGACATDGCERREYARGLCSKCYGQAYKDGIGNNHRPPAVCAPELNYYIYKFPPPDDSAFINGKRFRGYKKPLWELFPDRPMWGTSRAGWRDA